MGALAYLIVVGIIVIVWFAFLTADDNRADREDADFREGDSGNEPRLLDLNTIEEARLTDKTAPGNGMRDWVWPNITDSEKAERAIRGGYWAAIFVAAATTLIAVISITTGEPFLNLDGYALIDAALFAIVGWRLKHRSRVFAVVGIVLFGAGRAVMWMLTGSIEGWPVTILIALLFLNGARGAFAYHRLSNHLSLHTETSSEGIPELNAPSVDARLGELKSLYEQGLVDEVVYQQKQTDILRSL